MEASKSWAAFVSSSDEETFSVIYRTHGTMVWRICHRILGSGEEVDDAFQGTWIRLLVAARDQQSELSLTTADLVLARLATLEANRVRQKRNRLHQREVTMDPLPEPNAETIDGGNAASREELAAMVKAAMAVQPEIYRSALELHYLDGLTHQQVATVLQLPLGTVATRLRTGRARLMAALKRMGIANGGAALIVAGAMALQVTLPAAEAVYTEASAASATLPPATVDFSTISSKTAVPLLTTKAAGIATLCLIPLAIVMAIYFQPPSRLDNLTNVGSSKAEEVAPVEPLQEQSVETPQATELTPTPTATPAAVAAEAEGSLTVEGVVMDEQGSAIEGATVTIYYPVTPGENAAYELQEIDQTVTDRFGVYTIRTREEHVIALVVEADNFVTEARTEKDFFQIEVGEYFPKVRKETINLVLAKGQEVSVSIKSESGEPIANAQIHLMHPLSADSFYYKEDFQTDAFGVASLNRLASRNYDLWISADGFQSKHATLTGHDEVLNLTLQKGEATLGGFVRHGRTGEPIAGATVRAALHSELGKERENSVKMVPYIQGKTGTDGSYELKMSPGKFHVYPVAEGLRVINKDTGPKEGLIELLNGDHFLDHDFEMGTNVQYIRGVVIDSDTEKPLPDVHVTVNPAYSGDFHHMNPPEATSDSEGRFELVSSYGKIRANMLQFKKEGFKLNSAIKLEETSDQSLDPSVYTMEASMISSNDASIQLLDIEENPVHGARVQVRMSQNETSKYSMNAYGVSNQQGLMSINLPHEPMNISLLVHHPEGYSFVKEGLSQRDLVKNNPTVITVPTYTRASFLIVDEDHVPIPTAQVKILHQSFPRSYEKNALITSNGRLDIEKIVPDSYFAYVSGLGYLAKREQFTIGIDEEDKGPRIIVLEPTRSIKGRVVDHSGNPIAGVEVSIIRSLAIPGHIIDEKIPMKITEADGLFTFENYAQDKAVMSIRHGQRSETINAKFGDEVHDYILDVASFVLFVGVVVDGETGEALKDFSTTIIQHYHRNADLSVAGMSNPQSRKLSDGTFTYEINPAQIGSVKVTVQADGYATMESPVISIEEGKEASYIFEMSSGVTVTGRVVTEEGEPLRNTKVLGISTPGQRRQLNTMFNGYNQNVKPLITDADGRFTFERLAPGKTDIVAKPFGNYRQGELSVTIVGNSASQDIGDLVVQEGNVLKGVVLQLPDRRPIANVEVKANVQVDEGHWQERSIRTNNQGEFSLEGLPQGTTKVTASINECSFSTTKESEEWGFVEFLIGTESVSGKVTQNGQPHYFNITAKAEGRHDIQQSSSFTGEFTLSGLQPGVYTVTARSVQSEGERSTTVTIPTTEPVLIDIVTQQLHGRLLDSDGNPVEGVKMSVINLRNDEPTYATNQSWANTKADGTFTLEGVGPGRHKIRTYYKGASHDLTEFEISLGIDKDLGDVSLP